ncbi:MAG: hypothetical protein RQ801_09030, partial [Spirochaetaceae bacterium]|nr:hypothetical protein [Spirochaetaceae bacterium]
PVETYRTFPPTVHSGTVNDDAAYLRIMDNDGAGTLIWESPAYPVGSTLAGYVGTATPESGVHLQSFAIELSSGQLASATMPMRIEAFLYDQSVAAPIDPVTPDAELYTPYNAAGEGVIRWYASFSIAPNEIKNIHLSIPLDYP